MDYSKEFPDCLVLKIEEYDNKSGKLDATLYIYYDTKENKYVIRGQRSTEEMDSCTFSFTVIHDNYLTDFIKFIVCKENYWTYVLYNYDNMPANSNEVTYEFLKNHESKVYELAGYNKQDFSDENLLKNVKMIKNVFNFYN